MRKIQLITRLVSIVAILAAAYLLFGAISGGDDDPQVEYIKNLESIVDKAKGSNKKTDDSKTTSPLVSAANGFGLYLDPPPAPKAPVTKRSDESKKREPVSNVPRPTVVTTKFELLGTSYFESRPELSMALIDEPGKGLSWVRQSEKVGHLEIKEVRDGSIIVRDGERTEELKAKRQPVKSLIAGRNAGIPTVNMGFPSDSRSAPTSRFSINNRSKTSPINTKTASKTLSTASKPPVSRPPSTDPSQMEMMKKLTNIMKTSSKEGLPDANALMKMFDPGKVGNKEAQKLDSLGKELNETKKPSESSDKTTKSKIPTGGAVRRRAPRRK